MESESNLQFSTFNLPKGFQFSQGCLQAYVDCPRLFQLRYIERLSWPAPEAEPALENERHIQLGLDFHRLVQQYFLGIPETRLSNLALRDITLSHWWQNFRENGPNLSDYTHNQEISLSTGMGEYRLLAKYDLIALRVEDGETGHAGKAMIFDWKTSQQLPKREWQEKKLQTRVYPFLLAKAGAQLNHGQPIAPEEIEMVYWFSNFPTAPMKFIYSQDQFAADEKYLTELMDEINSIGKLEAPKTEQEKRCHFCVYRSLCNRGTKAGKLDELEAEAESQEGFDFELDFEQITEIEF